MNPTVAVVILNYNGKKLLQQFLPTVIACSQSAVIYVADNASTDGSVLFLQTNFPTVQIISLPKNYGFAKGYNEALKHIKADYFVLLNSDVEVSPLWIEPIIKVMEQDVSIAAAQPNILAYHQKDTFEYAGAAGGFIDTYGYPFCRGRIFNTLEKDIQQYHQTIEIFWATGACMFVRASVYEQLQGFDDFYFAHMEEIDLCWRIKNIGKKIVAVPQSLVYHVGGGTLNKLSPRKTFLNFRNSLLSLTKNNAQGVLFFKIVVRLFLDGIAGIKFLLEGNIKHTWAIIQAHFSYYKRLRTVLHQRQIFKNTSHYKPNHTQIYKGSIVWDYFVKGKRYFTDIKEKISG
ncbi:MAG: glycosyltransferase family 2 protein [Bacteroidetes bacterium]|nr:glycosyltransferase family 2 protein [Bacteroidota bacterium]